MSDEQKSVSNEIEIDADAETVWKALSDGEEIKRWFTLDARVTPGAGGAIWMSFGEGMEWETPIELWEPQRRLRTADPAPSPLAVDYFIEARGGKTVVRLVHSGFGADAWDEELDTLNSGWRTFLAQLRFYLERHRGEPRSVAYFRHPVVPLPRSEVFPRLLNSVGIDPNAAYAPGQRYESGELRGVVEVFGPPINFSATVENFGDAFLMLEVEPGRGQCRPSAWLSLYGDARSRQDELQEWLRGALTRAFGG